MLDATTLKAADLKGLRKSTMAELTAETLVRMTLMSTQLEALDKHAAAHIRRIKCKDARRERITFEPAVREPGSSTPRPNGMNAEQRQMFDETAAEDEASVEAQLRALHGTSEPDPLPAAQTKRKPRHPPLPQHLRRVQHHHGPRTPPARRRDAGRPWCAAAKT